MLAVPLRKPDHDNGTNNNNKRNGEKKKMLSFKCGAWSRVDPNSGSTKSLVYSKNHIVPQEYGNRDLWKEGPFVIVAHAHNQSNLHPPTNVINDHESSTVKLKRLVR